jgi:hypothetical protein
MSGFLSMFVLSGEISVLVILERVGSIVVGIRRVGIEAESETGCTNLKVVSELPATS